MRHCRAEGFVDVEPAAVVGRQTGRGKVEALGGRQPTGREQHRIGHESLPGLEVEDRAQRSALGHRERLHALPQAEGDVALSELVHELVDDFAIEELERPLATLDQGDLHADRREHRRVLDADHAGSDDRQSPGQRLEIYELVGIEHDHAVSLDPWRRRRPRPDRDDHVLCRHLFHARLAADGERVRIEKRRFAMDEGDVVAAELLLDDLDLAAYHGFDSGEELFGRGRIVLLGMVPVSMHTPPTQRRFSITAARRPSLAAWTAARCPAGPLPIETRSKS